MTAPTPAGAAPPTPTALLVTTDADLHDDVHRLAAAAGLPVEVAADPGAALRSWVPAAVVLVGADLAGVVAAAGPPARAGVHLVTRDGVRDALFRDALLLGARDVRALPEAEEWLVEMLTDAAD
ncbi:MAG: septum site-determining protein, partial [Nocardioides sp.]|nr:septum site-determining protein [Nocardioides sp.]